MAAVEGEDVVLSKHLEQVPKVVAVIADLVRVCSWFFYACLFLEDRIACLTIVAVHSSLASQFLHYYFQGLVR